MPLNDITPSSNIPKLSNGKKRFMDAQDDDNTFLPPALSSYSIALLNERTKQLPSHITGIYEFDFPNSRSKNNLKNKLSVHFRESDPIHTIEKSNTPHSSHNNNSAPMEPTNNANNNKSYNTGHNAMTITNSHMQNQSNVSAHNSFNLSTNNFSSHTHNTTSEYNDDLMDISPHESTSRNSSNHTPSTTFNENPPPSSSSQTKSSVPEVHTLKRMRGTRRFGRMLGPPKRAMKSSEDKGIQAEYDGISSNDHNDFQIPHDRAASINNDDNNDNNNNNNNINTKNNNNALSTPPPLFSMDFSPKINRIDNLKEKNPESVFFKTLKKMKSESPEDDIISKQKESELRRRIDEQKRINEIESQLSKSKSIQDIEMEISELNNSKNEANDILDKKAFISSYLADTKEERNKENIILSTSKNSTISVKNEQPRLPLNNVSPNRLNGVAADEADFRKPKLPKPILQQATTSNVTPPSSSDDYKRKKCISINGNQYEKLELLGRGGSSKVYKVKSLSNNKLFAIKKVTFDQFDELCVQGFKGEIDLLLKLKDADRVVKLVDHAIGEGSIYLVMECGDIDLAHVFQNKLSMNNVLDMNFVKYHSIEILKCVQAVHRAGIVHSDLKPANFLFIRGILKIIDFGIANAVPDHTANIYRESQIGTPNYMAPEALVEVSQAFPGLPTPDNNNNQQQLNGLQRNTWKVGKPSDVWSCGCIIYQMIYGRPPYGGYSGNQRVMAIMNPQVKIQYPGKGIGNIKVPQSAIALMQKCLTRNPNERWTVEECLNSDFLNPKIVSETFVRDLVHLAVNFGHNNRVNGNGLITADVYDRLVDTVLKQIEDLNFG